MNEEQNNDATKEEDASNSRKIIIIVLLVGAVLAFMIYSSNSKEQQATAEKQQQALTEIESKQQAHTEALSEAESVITQKEEELTASATELEKQTCMANLENAKTQKAVIEKEISNLKTIGKSIEDNPDYAIEICRYLSPGLSKNECATKIEGNIVTAQASVVEMELTIAELDVVISAGC